MQGLFANYNSDDSGAESENEIPPSSLGLSGGYNEEADPSTATTPSPEVVTRVEVKEDLSAVGSDHERMDDFYEVGISPGSCKSPTPAPLSPEQGEVDPELAERIEKLLALKARGETITNHIERSRDYSNPYVLERIIRMFELDEYGTNLPPEVFDPSRVAEHEYDYYDAKRATEKLPTASSSPAVPPSPAAAPVVPAAEVPAEVPSKTPEVEAQESAWNHG